MLGAPWTQKPASGGLFYVPHQSPWQAWLTVAKPQGGKKRQRKLAQLMLLMDHGKALSGIRHGLPSTPGCWHLYLLENLYASYQYQR